MKVRPKGGVLNGLLVGIVYRKLHQCQGFIPIVVVRPYVVAKHVLDDSVHSFRLTVSLRMKRSQKRLSRAHQSMESHAEMACESRIAIAEEFLWDTMISDDTI